MKKLLYSIIFLLSSFLLKAQTYPIQTNLGGPTTLVKSPNYGAYQGGIIPYSFADTLTANSSAPYLKNYDGSIIKTLSPPALWYRYLIGNQWIELNPSSTPTSDTLYWKVFGNNFTSLTGIGALGTLSPTNFFFQSNGLKRFGLHSSGILPYSSTVIPLGLDTTVAGEFFLARANPAGSTTPTWQQTLTAGSTLTGNNTIAGGGYDFTWDNTDNLAFNLIGSFGSSVTSGGKSTTISNTASLIQLTSQSGSGSSLINIYHDTIQINPLVGKLIIDTLNNETSQNTLMGWVSTSGANRGKVGNITVGTGLSLTSGNLTATSTGTVTSIATTSPITGGTITSTGTIACATCVVSAAGLTTNALVIGTAGTQATATTTTGAGILTWLGTPSSANLRGALTDENGTGVALFDAATSPSFTTSITTPSTTFSFANTTATTVTEYGAATTLTIGGTPTTAITHNYSTNATATATTKTINFGTGGTSGSTTAINIGSATSGAAASIKLNLAPASDANWDLYTRNTSGFLERIGNGTTGQVLTATTSSKATWATPSGLTNPMTTTGDMIYSSSGSTPARLEIGGEQDVMTVFNAIPSWQTVSGSYAPSITKETNCSGTSPAGWVWYLRNGNSVTVYGRIDIHPTLTATATSFDMSLPITDANFDNTDYAGGTGWCPAIIGSGFAVSSTDKANTVTVSFKSSDITLQSYYFSFTYFIYRG